MAKLTKKQEVQYNKLISLMHEMIQTKFTNCRADYEEVIAKIKEVVKDDKEV